MDHFELDPNISRQAINHRNCRFGEGFREGNQFQTLLGLQVRKEFYDGECH